MNALLKKNDLSKIQVLRAFADCSKFQTTHSLASLLSITPARLKRQINFLNEDLAEVFSSKVAILKIGDGYELSIEGELSYSYLLERLKLTYLEQTTSFIILQELFKKNYYSMEELAGSLFLSPSYIYKQITKLRKILHPLGVELSFGQEIGEPNFICSEEVLRYFIFAFYWSSFKTIQFPFQRITFNEEHFEISKIEPYISSSSKYQQMRFYLTFSDYRALIGNHALKLDEQFTAITLLLVDVNNVPIYSLDNYPNDFSGMLHQENLFFNFVTRTFLISIDSKENKVTLAKKFSTLDFPVPIFAKKFIDSVVLNWNLQLDEDTYYLLLYHTTLTLLFIDYIGIEFFKAFDFSSSFGMNTFPSYVPDDWYSDIKCFWSRFQQTNSEIKQYNIKEANFYIIYIWIYFIIDHSKDVKLLVAVNFSSNPIVELFIKQKLKSVFNVSNLVFIDDVTEADLVISNTSEPTVTQGNLFFIDNIIQKESWQLLFNCIQQKIFDKNF